MTVGESLINWLYTFGDILITDKIDTDKLEGEDGSLGLYKQATEDITTFVNGSRDITEYYNLLARQATVSDEARINNQSWADSLEAWIREKNLKRQLPALGRGKTCNTVAVSIGAYMSAAAESGSAEYQIAIAINYTEE